MNMNLYYISIYYPFTVVAQNIGTLGKYDQERLWKWIHSMNCIVKPFDLLFKKLTEFQFPPSGQ